MDVKPPTVNPSAVNTSAFKRPFSPKGAWQNPHVQSIMASFKLRRWALRLKRTTLDKNAQTLELDGGDSVKLQAIYSPQNTPRGLVIIIHGWEGSAESTYLYACASYFHQHGYAVARLHLRDHGDTHHLNEGMFHACRLDEVINGIRDLTQQCPITPTFLVGFSMGGNFALRVGIHARAAGLDFAHIIAISPAIVPKNVMDRIDAVPGYRDYFVKKWKRSLKKKQAAFPELYNFDPVMKTAKSVLDLANYGIAQGYVEFDNLDAYLEGYRVHADQLAALDIPTSIYTAVDDPVIPISDFDDLNDTDHVKIYRLKHGGHCGFMEGVGIYSWMGEEVLHRLEQYSLTPTD